ncbi:MAG: aminotransferase class I/II-fold pyridoxal phosphate-dependent enzyme [Terriglobales bacterium]|jgi:methionine-gamma-lyase
MPDQAKPSLADATHCVHAGEERHGTNASLTTDIAQTSVFVMPSLDELRRYAEGKSQAYMYSRYGNPTTTVAEQKIAALEGAEACVVTASGMAAELATIMAVCESGDEIVSMLDLYGGTTKLLQNVLPRFGIRTRFVPFRELNSIEGYFSERTRLLFLETPTNPTLRCADIRALSAIAHRHNAVVAVDSTFGTPILQKPLDLGADLSLHSATKYLGGHNDLTAGAVAGPRQWLDPIREMVKFTGGCLDPLGSFLLIRGLKTLEIRVERACANARAVAEALRRSQKVARVFYPGFADDPSHEVARRQMRDFGMMVSFDLKGGGAAAEKFIDALKLWYLATSLGGVESTVSYPLLSSHVGLTDKQLELLDVSAATVRLSVGIEHPADLVADLEQALDRA